MAFPITQISNRLEITAKPFLLITKEEEVESSFPVPTGSILPFLLAFRYKKSLKPKVRNGAVQVREYFIFKKKSSTVNGYLQIKRNTPQTTIDQLEKNLLGAFSPTGLKILDGIFKAIYENSGAGSFTFDINQFLDYLGYRRDAKDRHQSKNRNLVTETIETLREVKWRTKISQKNNQGKTQSRSMNNFLVFVTPSGGKRTITVNPFLHEDITKNKQFTWLDHRLLKMDTNRHGKAYLLGRYYQIQFRISWRKYKGILRRKLKTILEESGAGYAS